MNQKEYTIQELVQNPSFRRLVKGTASPGEIEKWNEWIEASGRNREKAKAAVSEITGFEFRDPSFPDVERKWMELYSKTADKEKKKHSARRRNEQKLNWIFRVAAVLLLISTVGLGVYLLSQQEEPVTHLEQLTEEKTIATNEGEQKTLRFSNGSRVVLNSNSTLTYSLGLLRDQTIQVTLDGEAWFVADSDPSQEQPVFAVSTPDGIIRDIGTEFLVSVHKTGSRVILQEGLVEVSPADRKSPGSEESQKVFSVEKGEMVEFSRETVLKREKVNPTFYTSWATGFMQLDRTSLEEFAGYVEQRFDVKLEVVDPELAGITLDGAVYFKSLEGLVRSVSEVTGIPVYRSAERDTVYVGNPNES